MNTKPNFSRKQNIAHRALVLKMLWVHHTALARVNTLALWRMAQRDILRGKKSDLVSNNKGERHEVTAGACPRGIEGGFPLLLEVKEPEGSL